LEVLFCLNHIKKLRHVNASNSKQFLKERKYAKIEDNNINKKINENFIRNKIIIRERRNNNLINKLEKSKDITIRSKNNYGRKRLHIKKHFVKQDNKEIENKKETNNKYIIDPRLAKLLNKEYPITLDEFVFSVRDYCRNNRMYDEVDDVCWIYKDGNLRTILNADILKKDDIHLILKKFLDHSKFRFYIN
jgi:hypothetical protein